MQWIILNKIDIPQVYADGYVPREIEFMVVDQHPTLLNVTLHPARVSNLTFTIKQFHLIIIFMIIPTSL